MAGPANAVAAAMAAVATHLEIRMKVSFDNFGMQAKHCNETGRKLLQPRRPHGVTNCNSKADTIANYSGKVTR